MRYGLWLVLLLGICWLGCSEKKGLPTTQDRKQIDDEMRKAIEQNKTKRQ